jgi:hypothetical protein
LPDAINAQHSYAKSVSIFVTSVVLTCARIARLFVNSAASSFVILANAAARNDN